MLSSTRLCLKRARPRLVLRRYASESADAAPALRSQPWQFDAEANAASRPGQVGTTSQARYNLSLQDHLIRKDAAGALALAAEMKRNGITPDQTTYDTLARTLTSRGLHRDVWALLEDMEALDVMPSQALLIEMAKVRYPPPYLECMLISLTECEYFILRPVLGHTGRDEEARHSSHRVDMDKCHSAVCTCWQRRARP